MSILNDKEISLLYVLPNSEYKMITPFVDHSVSNIDGKRVLSYGLSSFGYDVRLTRKFKIFSNINSTIIDTLNFDDRNCVDHEGDFCIIPPNSYILGSTIEYFNIPDDIIVMCIGKSTIARAGAMVNVTPVEPGFKGNIVIEIANLTPIPLKIYAGMGIAQFMFFKGNKCNKSYADKGGRYQGQEGITLAR